MSQAGVTAGQDRLPTLSKSCRYSGSASGAPLSSRAGTRTGSPGACRSALDGSVPNLGAREAIYLKFADLEASFRFCLNGISWPPRLQADVRAVLADSSAAEDRYRGNAAVADPAYLMPPDQVKAGRSAYAAAVLRLRTDLGLPSSPPDSPAPSAPAA
jgi:hypothetical protein